MGFAQAGFNTGWANEFSSDAAKSFEAIVGHNAVVGDIQELQEHIENSEILIGGPPCQSFSLVGKRDPQDKRGELVFTFAEVVERSTPTAFVMENVQGLLAYTIDGVRLIDVLSNRFENLGYKVSLIKLNAADYFVPQKRKRIFLIGQRISDDDFKMITPNEFGELLGFGSQKQFVSVSEALGDLPPINPKGNNDLTSYEKGPTSHFAKLMRAPKSDGVTLHSMPTMSARDSEYVKFIPPGGNYTSIPDEIATGRILRIKGTGGRTTTYGRLHPDEPAYTINTYFNRPNVGANYHYSEERLISVREALRLQSFPDWFTPYFSSQRSLHQQIGNAVPPLLGRAVAESLKRLIYK